MGGTLFVVATPIGNLEDITARALRVLRDAALIAAEDTRRTAQLLTRYAIATPTTSLHEHNERTKSASIVARLLAGDSIALVSDAGTPGISDPGQRLIKSAIDAGIRVEPVPGPNAAIAALSASGFEASRFTFLGFPPTRSKDRKQWLSVLSQTTGTVVFYEAPHRIQETLEEIQAVIGDCPGVLGRELTKANEELVRGPISALFKRLRSPKGEFTVVLEIGQKTELEVPEPPGDAQIYTEFGHLTELLSNSRRAVIAALAKKHSLSPNAVKSAIERARKLVD